MLESTAIAGAVLIGLGVLAPLLTGRIRAALWLQMLGILALGLVGAVVFASGSTLGSGFQDKVSPSVGIDPLSGFFLLTLAIVALPALGFALGSLQGAPSARGVASLTGIFIAALAGVLVARDVATFLATWELMTVIPAGAILLTRRERSARNAVYVYLATTHLGGAGVWIALLMLAHLHAFGTSAALAAHGEAAQLVVGAFAIVGFGTKAGIMPMHSWLPRAHPIAPSHFSALMSGMMIKVAIYGLIRVLIGMPGPASLWLGFALLALGAVSSLGGVVYALVQHELKRLLAFHSVENIGIIALAIGASLVLRAEGAQLWASIALAAGLFHTMNHAVFKALLFLGAGAFSHSIGGLHLDHMGGLLEAMPWSGGAFFVGAMAIAGLPPLNGFISEWLALEALVHIATDTPLKSALPGALAAAALAATAALAVLCFAKVVGLVLLGRPRTDKCARATEVPMSMTSSMIALATTCVVLGAVPGLVVNRLIGLTHGPELAQPLLGLSLPGTGTLPALELFGVLVALVALLAWMRSRGSAAPGPVWACGQRLDPELSWTSAGFTKPLRLLLEPALRVERTVVVEDDDLIVSRVSYQSQVPHLFDTHLYRPVVKAALLLARVARRVQSGSLRTYVAYLFALVVVMLVIVDLGVLR